MRILRWAGYGLAGLVGLVVLVAGGALAASEVIIRMPHEKPVVQIAAARDPGAVARGQRLAVVQGCTGCHGPGLQGMMFDDLPNIARLYAPNLTRAVARQSDADLDRAIRHGIGADGRALWVMPSATFAHLTDAETADLLAYLRTLKPAGPEQPRLQVRPLGRIGMLIGKFKSERTVIAAHENPPLPDVGPDYAEGRSLARACVECHGPALKGGGVTNAPDLQVAAAYDAADFEAFMRTGKAAGGRELKMMSPTARTRFASLTSQEIAALHAYLKARAAGLAALAETDGLSKPY